MLPTELKHIISLGETSKVQFKETIHSPIQLTYEMVALSNALGGMIIIGVSDKKGEIKGLDMESIRKINQWVASAADQTVKPAITPLTEIINIEEKEATPEPSTQEIILEKIRSNSPAQQIAPLPMEKVKSTEVKGVEENAEKLKNLGESGQDTYRESLE